MFNKILIGSLMLVTFVPTAVHAATGFALVELFASEGCSSCPPADEVLRAITAQAKREGLPVYTLSFQVDYWNNLGWVDPFSRPEFTQRQYWYANILPSKDVYTPQMIINGMDSFVGSDSRKATMLINEALVRKEVQSFDIKLEQTKGKDIIVKYALDGDLKNVVLNSALVENNVQSRPNAGENAGALLIHDHLVRQWQTIQAPMASGAITFNALSIQQLSQYSVIMFLQNTQNGRVLSVNSVDLL